MKSLFTAVLLVSFVGIAVFGFVGMLHSDSQNHNNDCILAASQGTDCSKQSNSIDYLTFHLNALKNFLIVTFSNATSFLIFSLFVVGIALGALLKNLAPPKFSLAYHRLRRLDSFCPPSQYKLIHWLSLHENSPARS